MQQRLKQGKGVKAVSKKQEAASGVENADSRWLLKTRVDQQNEFNRPSFISSVLFHVTVLT